MDFKAVLQAIEANLASKPQRVTGESGISPFSVVHHFHDFGKNIDIYWNVPKYWKTFDSPK